MQVLKVFYEEPAALGSAGLAGGPGAEPGAGGVDDGAAFLDALRARPASGRVYLAGTDLGANRAGLTALPPAAWATPLGVVLGPSVWAFDGVHVRRAALTDPLARVEVFAWGPAPPDPLGLSAALVPERPLALAAVAALLAGGHAVAFPVPAADGHDLDVFAPFPLHGRLVAALRAAPVAGVRRFVAPLARMRSESKFHFERWALPGALPDAVEEV